MSRLKHLWALFMLGKLVMGEEIDSTWLIAARHPSRLLH